MRDYVKGERRSHKFKRAKIEIDKPQTVGKVNLSSVQEKSRTLSRKVSRDEPDDEGQESVLPKIPSKTLPIKEKILEKVEKRQRGDLERILLINRVGIQIRTTVYKDGHNICICIELGDICKPEEPIMYFDLKRIPIRPYKPMGVRE